MSKVSTLLLAGLLWTLNAAAADASEIRVLTAGAMKSVIIQLAPEFQKQTGHTLSIDNGTTGALVKRIGDGESFDVAIITPAVIDDLSATGKIVTGSMTLVAKVGIGVAAKTGALRPDIATLDAFKRALLAAKSVAYIDPKSGGSSGIYFDRLLETMGIAQAVRAKAKLKQGGYVAEWVADGTADLAVHQISEILPVKGATLVGPLPAEVQNYTIYAGGIGSAARDPAAAQAFVEFLISEAARASLQAKGMEAP